MVIRHELDSGDSLFIIQPNGSLSWVWMKRLFGFLACSVAAVGTYFAAQGAWLVLPFAGLELIAIGAGIYASARWSAGREVIEIKGNDLRILRGRRLLTEIHRLPRHWTRVNLRQDPRGWYPSRLLLECHGRGLEIAQPLVESERLQLAEDLRTRLSFRLSPTFARTTPLPEGLDTASEKV